MAIEQYIVLQGDVASSEDLSDVNLSGTSEFDVMIRNGSSEWVNGTLGTSSLADASVTLAKIADAAANDKLLGSGNAGSGNPYVELSIGASFVMNSTTLERAALTGDVTASQNDNAMTIAAGVVTLAKIADAIGNDKLLGSNNSGAGNPYIELTLGSNLSITGSTLNAAGAAGALNDLSDVTLTSPATDAILIKTAGDWIDGLIQTGSVADGAITFPKMVDASAASRLLGRGSAGGSGDFEEITVGTSLNFDGVNLERSAISGDVDIPLDSNTATIQPDSVVFDMLLDATGSAKLIGRGDGGAGTFQEITLGGNMTMTGTVLDSTGGGAGSLNDLSDVTLTSPATDSILIKTAGDYIDGLIVTNSITNSAVTLAKIQNAAANERLVGSGAAGSGNPYTELTIGSSLSFAGTVLSVANPSSTGLSGYVMVSTPGGNSRVIADHNDTTPIGDARLDHSVDLQTDRANVNQVAAAQNATIGGGRSNRITGRTGTIAGGTTSNILTGASGQNNTISGGSNNDILTSGTGSATIGGGQANEVIKNHGSVPGGRTATSRRFGEQAYGGASAADGQVVKNVATLLTSDATQTIMGYTSNSGTWASTILDAATIPFPSSGTYMMAFEGYVIGMRGEVASDEACCFKIEGAMKKNNAGTVSFVGNPKVSVVGRDDVSLDCDIVLAGSNAGANIRVTGIAAEDWVWTCEWEGPEMLVPAL